ncbi:MAG: hypothetical protein AAF605_09200 [Myxococcota bacterium]
MKLHELLKRLKDGFFRSGVRGRLYNLFVDADLRVAFGENLSDPDGGGLFILRRVETAGER